MINEKIKLLQKEIFINEDLIKELKHLNRIDYIFKIMILITILGIHISIFTLTKPLSIVLPPILSFLVGLEIIAKIAITGGTGSKKTRNQEIAFYEEKIQNYKNQIKDLKRKIIKEKVLQEKLNYYENSLETKQDEIIVKDEILIRKLTR